MLQSKGILTGFSKPNNNENIIRNIIVVDFAIVYLQ